MEYDLMALHLSYTVIHDVTYDFEYLNNIMNKEKGKNKYSCFSQEKVRSGNTLIKINCRKNEPMSEIVARSKFSFPLGELLLTAEM